MMLAYGALTLEKSSGEGTRRYLGTSLPSVRHRAAVSWRGKCALQFKSTTTSAHLPTETPKF